MPSPRPPLSVVIPTRGGLAEIAPVLDVLEAPAESLGVELLVVGDTSAEESPSPAVRMLPTPDGDIYALRRLGVIEARGTVVAIGEDHAVPRDGWCEAVIRAHAEHPEAAAVVCCLDNATEATVGGRANFFSFASPWLPPMQTLPDRRPPPVSTLSFKREALSGAESAGVGWLESELTPSLFAEGAMVADGTIVIDHHQDHGVLWPVRNAYDSARASYGYQRASLDPARRREVARWTARWIAPGMLREARGASRRTRVGAREWALIALISVGAGIGGTAGALLGPGRSPTRVA